MEMFIVHFNKVGPTSGPSNQLKLNGELSRACVRTLISILSHFVPKMKRDKSHMELHEILQASHYIKPEIRCFLMFSTHCQLILVLKCHRVAASERMITPEQQQ